MDYPALFKRTWHITFKHKFLWLFGLFLGTSGFSGGFNYSFANFDLQGGETIDYQDFQVFFNENFIWILILCLVLFFLFLAFTFLRIVAEASLIGSVDRIEKGDEMNFTRAFKLGLKYFWKMLAIKSLLGILVFVVLALFVIPTVILFILNMPLRGLIFSLLGLIILVPLFIIFSFVAILSFRFTIIKNEGVIKSIKSGASLFKKNIGPSLIIFLILFGISLAFSLFLTLFFVLFFLIFGVPALISLILGTISNSLLSTLGFIPLLIIVMLALLAVSFLTNAILNTYKSALWTLTFNELTKS